MFPVSGSFKTHFNNSVSYPPLQDMKVTEVQCRAAGWDYADGGSTGVTWHNNYQRTGASGTSGNTPKSTLVTITCAESDLTTGKCKTWVVEPQTDPSRSGCEDGGTAAVADVVKETAGKPRSTNVGHGTYYLPFRLTLRRQ